jgi:Ca2+-binding EF-hand superfamily protein
MREIFEDKERLEELRESFKLLDRGGTGKVSPRPRTLNPKP